MLEDQMNIKIYRTPPDHSTANGPIERFHSTLAEIMRCFNAEKLYNSFDELLKQSVIKYNYSIHSTTNQKPAAIIFGRFISNDPLDYEKLRQENIIKIKNKQERDLSYLNRNRQPPKVFKPGEKIFVKINKRYGTKLTNKYKEETVKEDKNTTVLTESGKIVYKGLIKS